jgi:integrase
VTKLTAKSVATLALPEGVADKIFWDDDVPGFGVRLRAGGSRSWIFRYKFGNTQRSVKLGNATSVAFAVARQNAGLIEAKVRLGEDPAGAKAEARRAVAHTFGAVVETFLQQKQSELRDVSLYEYTRYLTKDCASLHRLPVSAVTQADVAKLLNGRGASSANRLRAALSALFAHCLYEGITLPNGNVAQYCRKRDEVSRDRVLNPEELKAIWKALDAGIGDDYPAIVRLLLLTGCRAREIGNLTWAEIKGDVIELPADRVKNGRAHIIPLGSAAQKIVAKWAKKREHLFGRRSGNGFQSWSKAKAELDKVLGADFAPWRLHDLRRTCATGMASLGVQPHIVEAVLNHQGGSKGGIAGIYNRHAYDAEKKHALELWGQHVTRVVS